MNLTIITQLAIALILGAIIGIERGWRNREEDEGYGDSGLRSFSLIGLLGGIAALLAQHWGFGILIGIFLGLAGLAATSYALTSQKSQDYGSTTELALLTTFCLGALALSGFTQEAIAIAVVVAWILGAKPELHKTLNWLQRQELIATLQLLLIAVVVLPLLPNYTIDPWDAIHPRAIGWLVLLIAGISYIGYFAIRILGGKVGLLLTAFFGGIASSTALTVSFSRMAKQRPNETILIAAGIILANGIMAPRLLLVIAIISKTLALKLAAPLLMLGLIPLIAAGIIVRWKAPPQTKTEATVTVSNPVEIGSALQYTALLVILSLLVRWAQTEFGEQGIYLLAALSGIADLDAVSLSLARAVEGDLPEKVAIYGIWLAVTVNTIVKISLSRVIGNAKLAYWCGSILLSGLMAGFLVLLAV
jgi:uncharacterized membrane protein (DUF4010 family)